MIYADYAATAPLRKEVLEAMLPYLRAHWGNPSSIHAPGRAAKNAAETARLAVAELFGVSMGEVFFTGSGTEADNIAIFSAFSAKTASPGHMITTAIEHEAVLECARTLEKSGVEVSYLAPDAHGVVSAEQVKDALREDTFLVSVMAVNNELGTVQPVREIYESIGGRVPLHVDAVQAAGHMPIESYAFADLFSISAHKFSGPKGVGALISRMPLTPRTFGGGQERGIRSGTENVAGIIGLKTALALAEAEREESTEKVRALSAYLRKAFADRKGLTLTVPDADPRIVHLLVEGIDRDVLLFQLDRRGLYASAGSACQAGASTEGHVMAAMGISTKDKAPLRLSLDARNTMEEMEEIVEIIDAVLDGRKE
ncbi:Cysteine desulfurase [Aedoeadaptatus ivorii]|uniref:Cysteine desulfurase n=1 Tax=Aedoeadaptatus ivorii TaxID=54006 RepID=A0A3S4ZPH6_9FIRM|nr:cysteine desulfurase family protein [Peptoniphilus ivorii]VEJ34188.1 Cysteine desulfurase [Peptoniphilus ivorii]